MRVHVVVDENVKTASRRIAWHTRYADVPSTRGLPFGGFGRLLVAVPT